MTPYYERDGITIFHADCRELLPTMEAGRVDAVVTDPPYGLYFMGKKWDYNVPSVEAWSECLRVLKPGAHLLAFAGTRTQHRMAVRIEDAGFEIRDMIAWVYGSGFPKSLDVSKAIDKAAGAERPRSVCQTFGGTFSDDNGQTYGTVISDVPVTAARQWQGWGTALKPALETITVARKPLVGTVAENVLAHGTGALNIDGCRVATDDKLGGGRVSTTTDGWDRPWKHDAEAVAACRERGEAAVARAETLGRWPANLIHDGSEEVLAAFPVTGKSTGGQDSIAKGFGEFGGGYRTTEKRDPGYGDSGSAARFFYCCKASKRDRGEGNTHPTVKPNELMRYLCRLVTPPNATILDPFAGSCTTGVAAWNLGRKAILCEIDEKYCEIGAKRLDRVISQGRLFKPDRVQETQRELFADAE